MAEATGSPNRGARRIADVPPEHLAALHRGEAEARTLAECLAIDLPTLWRNVTPPAWHSAADAFPKAGVVRDMTFFGIELAVRAGDEASLAPYLAHRSDTVRAWGAYALAALPAPSFAERLRALRPLADDANSGVREWAWMALRPHVAASLEEALALLPEWSEDASPRIRRFASEITRPRGVWCARLKALVAEPWHAAPILEPLRADPEKYVRDSVANWLNDASKSQPHWVRETVARWLRESPCAETRAIAKRGLRTLEG